ncbi:YlxM family DNA-binding protein [Brassicibacter mesophilus]|uniref:YlxM family DNA-binding protein n=1 Tax=Brassicibacter mesophilus TaxID=745119 RepID=UPI003D22C5C8
MFEKIIEIGLLFDFYGRLLNDRQYIAIELYYIHDLSLSEVGEHLEISRQGVHDILKRAENSLYKYEEKLGLVKKFIDNKEKQKYILNYVENIIQEAMNINSEEILLNAKMIKEITLDIIESGQEVK